MEKQNELKKRVALAAVDLVKEGMIVGLGSGSTAKYFIEALGERCREGLSIHGVATSKSSARLAIEEKIPLISINRLERVDIDIDGADQVDPNLQLVKGLGGALMKEKIIAHVSNEFVVIVDESKLVPKLGGGALPLEVLPSVDQLLIRQIETLGYKSQIRQTKGGVNYVTDNQNHIIDVDLPADLGDPKELEQKLQALPGVLESGFFFNLATKVLVAKKSGEVETMERKL